MASDSKENYLSFIITCLTTGSIIRATKDRTLNTAVSLMEVYCPEDIPHVMACQYRDEYIEAIKEIVFVTLTKLLEEHKKD